MGAATPATLTQYDTDCLLLLVYVQPVLAHYGACTLDAALRQFLLDSARERLATYLCLQLKARLSLTYVVQPCFAAGR
jgi:hypothetical protein